MKTWIKKAAPWVLSGISILGSAIAVSKVAKKPWYEQKEAKESLIFLMRVGEKALNENKFTNDELNSLAIDAGMI